MSREESRFDPGSQKMFCFICSDNQVTVEYSNILLRISNLENTEDEKRKLMTVLCQLLRVKWTVVQDLFIHSVHFPFCENCLQSVINMISLREQLFEIETNIRKKIGNIEKSIAQNFQHEKIENWSLNETEGNNSYTDYRQNFQNEVMQEYRNKEMLKDKVEEMMRIRSESTAINLSLIQLQLEKNIYQIDEPSNSATLSVSNNLDVINLDAEILNIEDREPEAMRWSEDYPNVLGISNTVYDTYNNSLECEYTIGIVAPDIQPLVGIDNSNDELQSKQPIPATTPESANVENDAKLATIIEPLTQKCIRCACGDISNNLPKNKNLKTKQKQKNYENLMKTRSRINEKPLQHFCPFCPAKFQIVSKFREHLLITHFASQKKIEEQSKENLTASESEREDDENVKKFQENLEVKDLYDSAEMVETSEDETKLEPIAAEISSTSDDETDFEENIESRQDEKVASDDSQEMKKIYTPPVKRQIHFTPPKAKRKKSRQRTKPSPVSVSTSELAKLPNTTEGEEYEGKDKTIWTTIEPLKTKTRAYNILRENGKLLGKAADPNLTPAELMKLMITPDIVDLVVKYTNKFAENYMEKKNARTKEDTTVEIISPNSSKRRCIRYPESWNPTNRDEIYAYIGILLYFGLEKKGISGLKEAWNTNGKYTIPCIAATMPRDRFATISSFLRFDDQVARHNAIAEGKMPSKLCYVSEVFDPFVDNIQSLLRPFENLVVDEMLVKFKGTSKFRVYMKSKPGKYGMKIWACCDAKTGYVLRLILYQGKQGDKVETQLGKNVVLGLVKKYFGSGRGVTTDNFFTSKSLGQELMDKKMSLLGTLNKNRMDIIPAFVDGRGREVESSLFAFYKDFTMVSYVPRKNRTVVLLSTQHHTREIEPEIKNKPIIILDYNKTKGGVDTADQMIAKYSCQRKTNRWPMKIFFAICDIGALNAYNIWKMHMTASSKNVTRLDFLRTLSEALMEPVIEERARRPRSYMLSLSTKSAMKTMGHPVPLPITVTPNCSTSQGRCNICEGNSKSRKKTRNRCKLCNLYICKSHSEIVYYCVGCKNQPDKKKFDIAKLEKEDSTLVAQKEMQLFKKFTAVKEFAPNSPSLCINGIESLKLSPYHKLNVARQLFTPEKPYSPDIIG